MTRPLRIAFFGSSLLSAYWNGAATYYRGIVRALDALGHRVTFYEPDAFERQRHRDLDPPEWAECVVWDARDEAGARGALQAAAGADVVVKASGVGVFDRLLEEAVLDLKGEGRLVLFWDVDAPATLERLGRDPHDPFLPLIPEYDLVLTYGGGDPVVAAYRGFGAVDCVPVYNALDSSTHHPVPPEQRFRAELSFLGNRMPDREARVESFFFQPAEALPGHRFILGGSGWADRARGIENVRYLGHVYTEEHNAFNASPLAVLNVSRESMARFGFSPATRIFEAAGAGACIVTDAWEGIDRFLAPGRECLVAESGEAVAEHLRHLEPGRAREIGEAARVRVLEEHTYARRALQVHELLVRMGAGEVAA